MIKFLKKGMEDTKDINSWVFEKDVSQTFMENFDKKFKRIQKTVSICLLLIVLTIFIICTYHYQSIWKSSVLILCPIIIGILSMQLLSIIFSWLWKWKIVRKYWPLIVFPAVALVIVIMFVNNIHSESNLSLQRSDILGFCGDFLSFLGAFCLGYFIYVQDCERRIEEKRSKVRLLITQIENANTELLRLNQFYRYKKSNQLSENQVVVEPILFDSNWFNYYLEYESLKGRNSDLKSTLSAFFDNIERINIAIKKGNMEFAVEINKRYIDHLNYSTQKYSELEAITCLMAACDDYNFCNSKSWLEQEETINLINELCKKYYFLIENYVYSWLLKHNQRTTTERDDLNREISDWLLNNSPEIKEIIRFPSERRIISRVVFDCSCKFSRQSKKIDYVWGEYSLK